MLVLESGAYADRLGFHEFTTGLESLITLAFLSNYDAS